MQSLKKDNILIFKKIKKDQHEVKIKIIKSCTGTYHWNIYRNRLFIK